VGNASKRRFPGLEEREGEEWRVRDNLGEAQL